MNETMIDLDHYVAEVRRHLDDLASDDREELTECLAADLAELVDERGTDSLPSPEAYAEELRAAAGLPAGSGRGRVRREWELPRAAMEAMDAAHAHWDRLLDAVPGDIRGFLTAVQPVWWVARAWVAWMIAQDARGTQLALWNGPWLAVLAVLVVASVQLGRRAWGFDRILRASVPARLLLVALNIIAVAMLPGSADRAAWGIADDRAGVYYSDTSESDVNPGVITYQGGQACVLEVFDATGKPVPGGYVWDATGERRLPMNTDNC